MRNKVGQIVFGKDYYPRNKTTKEIFNNLEADDNVYLAAPRRAGKSSIFRNIVSNPQGYVPILLNVEDVETPERYYINFYKVLKKNPTIQKTVIEKGKQEGFEPKKWWQRINQIGFLEYFSIGFSKKKEIRKDDAFQQLLAALNLRGIRLLLLIDEFPQAVENIKRKEGFDMARQFLFHNRNLRQSLPFIRFIYTGSIGLHSVAKRLDASTSINDFETVSVLPLDHTEAFDFTEQLLRGQDICFEKETVTYILERIRYYVPFYIQLLIHELKKNFSKEKAIPTKANINAAFEAICSQRQNKNFASYYERLKKNYDTNAHALVMDILSRIAKKETLTVNTIQGIAKREYKINNCTSYLESLEHDGYIHKISNAYCFNSPILRHWWLKYMS